MSKLKPMGVQELYAAALRLYTGNPTDAILEALQLRAAVEEHVESRDAALAAIATAEKAHEADNAVQS